ncbi:MAG: DUF697 domain-containing protein [Proteobacteria bacterium]|nr:DUF697 domain-containing protein [Pseudomonadota bacterium]
MSTDTQAKTAAPETKAKAAATTETAAEASSCSASACETEETREERALCAIKKYMYGNAAASLVPVPILDLVAATGIQLAMVRAVANIYDVPFKQEAAREVITTLITGIGTRSLGLGVALSFVKLVPGVGTALGMVSLPVITGGLTYAVGKVFIMHFEAGGNLLNLDAKKMRAYFKQQFEEGLEQAKAAAKEQSGAAK